MRALNPNRYAQAFGDSTLERLKKEIIGQEVIFRNQVRELHRLYCTQKNLMNDLRLIGFNAHASKEKNAYSEQYRDRKGGNALDMNAGAMLNNYQRIFNLQVPADDYISGSKHEKQINHDSETFLSNPKGDFEIGCGIGEVVIEKGLCAPGSFRCSEVIDLEDSLGVEYCHEANEVLCDFISTPVRQGLLRSQPIVPCERVSSSMNGSNMYCLTSIDPLGEGQDRILQEQNPHVSCIGHGDSTVDTVYVLSTNKHRSRPELIDLNIPLEDECFYDHNQHLVKIASPSKNSSIVCHGNFDLEPTKGCLDKISFASKFDSTKPASKNSCEKRTEWLFILNQDTQCQDSEESMIDGNNTKDNTDNVNEVVITGRSSAYEVPAVCCRSPVEVFTGSDCRAQGSINGASISAMDLSKQGKENLDFSPDKLQCKELSDNKRQDSNITYSNSVNQSQTVSRDSTEKLSNQEESEEHTLSSHSTAQDDTRPDELKKKFSAEYNSNGISDNNSESSSYEKNSKEPATLSITDDSIITQSHSSKHELSYIGKSKLKGRDVSIAAAAAAEALMTISFGRSGIATEQLDVMQTVEVQCDVPQHSSDSFEFMAMHLSEVENEDHNVKTELPSLNETQKNDNGVRLRRGRRLRDFRKEILPGLVSLSRHEICEDLYSIGYNLRQNAPKTARGNWFLPVRSRRSRLYLGCRRL